MPKRRNNSLILQNQTGIRIPMSQICATPTKLDRKEFF